MLTGAIQQHWKVKAGAIGTASAAAVRPISCSWQAAAEGKAPALCGDMLQHELRIISSTLHVLKQHAASQGWMSQPQHRLARQQTCCLPAAACRMQLEGLQQAKFGNCTSTRSEASQMPTVATVCAHLAPLTAGTGVQGDPDCGLHILLQTAGP